MPCAYRHEGTGELLARVQRNGYGLAYYGIVLGESAESADSETESGRDPAYTPVELTEHDAKMANVKLRNDPGRAVYYRDGVLEARQRE